MSGRKYFPNNWKQFKDADPDMFIPHTFFEVMAWKVEGWELPANVDCMIRTTHKETKKTKEYIYLRHHAAERRIIKLLQEQTHDFCLTTHDDQVTNDEFHIIYLPTDDEQLL